MQKFISLVGSGEDHPVDHIPIIFSEFQYVQNNYLIYSLIRIITDQRKVIKSEDP